MRQRYTRGVGSWTHRVVCLVLTAALTGAPAALAACAALCAVHVDRGAPGGGHGATCATVQVEAQLTAAASCCPNCGMAPPISVAAQRADGCVWLAVALSAIDTPSHVSKSVKVAPQTGPPIAVPSSSRSAPVLRI